MEYFQSSYIKECMKQFLINSPEQYSYIFEEYKQKLVKIQKELFFKCNIKTFSYCANNVINKIFSYLPFFGTINFSLTSKRYFELFQNYDNDTITLFKYNQYPLINLFPKKKFHFDCNRITKLKKNIIKLNNCYSLKLTHYRNIDVSFLKNIKMLNLSNSYYIKNVDCLKNVDYLNLTGCTGIINFDGLADGKIKYLNLSSTRINNVDKFVNVEHLILRSCYNLPYISYLPKLKVLDISRSYSIKDIDHSFINSLKGLRITGSRLNKETIEYFSLLLH
jgi:hypothetical protein